MKDRHPKKAASKDNNGANGDKKPMDSMQTIAWLSQATGLSAAQIGGLFDALAGLAKKNLNEGRGEFTIPGLLKLKVVLAPATEERTGIHPITKKRTVFQAKPARNVVKMVPSTGLSEAVA